MAIIWVRWSLAAFNRFLYTLSLTFLAISGIFTAQQWFAERSQGNIELPPWSKQEFDLKLSESPPDIYFLIFDRYGGLETLRDDYQFDNSAFYDELKKRGFEVNDRKPLELSSHPAIPWHLALNCEYLPEEVQRERVLHTVD